MQPLKIIGFILISATLANAKQREMNQAVVDFDTFVDLIEKSHPQKSIDLLIESRATQLENKAGTLMDPEISLGREKIPLTTPMGEEMFESQAAWTLNITQMIPWPGTLRAENVAAQASVSQTKINTKFKAAERIFNGKEFFIRLVAASRMRDIERKNLADSLTILKNSETRLRHGIGSHHELIQAQNEKTLLSLNLDAIEVDFLNLKDHAAQWIGKSDGSEVTFILNLPKKYTLYSQLAASSQSLDTKTSDLTQQSLTAKQNESIAQLELERKKTLPTFMLSGMLMQEDKGMRMYGFMAGIKIPIYSNSIRTSIENEKLIVTQKTAEELIWHDKRKHLAKIQNDRRKMAVAAQLKSLEKEIVANARQHLKTLDLEYAQGKSSFVQVNEARRLLLRYELAKVAAERDFALAILSEERIDAGLIETEIDLPTPQLASPAMTNMGGESMSNGMGKSMNQSAPMKKESKRIPMGQEEDESTPNVGGMGGM